jgi:hypothetical protein
MVNKKTKYDLMRDSPIATDTYGNFYADLTTFPINYFSVSAKPTTAQLSENDCLRFCDYIKKVYGQYEFYDDILLWLNDVEYITDTEANFEKYLKNYSMSDISVWYRKFSN